MKLMKTIILKAAITVISRDGIHNFSPKSVAEEAGCSEALIYHHFGTKRGLIDACYIHLSRELSEAMSSADPGEGKRLAPIWRALFGFLGDDKDLARFILMYIQEIAVGLPEELQYLKDAITEGYEGRMDAEDLEAFSVQAARSLVLVACVYSIEGAAYGRRFSEQYRALLELIAEGFSADGPSQDSKTE